MMENYLKEELNVKDYSLNVESVFSHNKTNNDVENVEMGSSNESVIEANCEENEIVGGKDTTENISRGESAECDSNQDGENYKEKQVLVRNSEKDVHKSNKENIDESHISKRFTYKSTGPKRKSKNQIKEERMKIQSETHRLMREREISIPYHLPKKRTLKEFLSRKKNLANVPLNMPSSKMVEIWKDIEESTRNAFEFFKSDSESEAENCSNSEKQGKINVEFQKIEDGQLKCYQDFDNSNNNSNNTNNYNNNNNNNESSCQTLDTGNNESENENLIFRTRKLDCGKVDRGEHVVTHNGDNTVFVCEVTVLEDNGLDGGKSDCLTKVQEIPVAAGSVNDDSAAVDDTSKLVIDMNLEQNDNSEIDNLSEDQDEIYMKQRTSEWVKNIPVYEKLPKNQNKKEILLQKLNPKLLKITPKLSGAPDSFIDLENDKNIIAIGAKNLKKRFMENCIAPRNKPKTEVELTITSSEKNERGEIKTIETEKLIYSSADVLNDPDLEKPGAKIQRLREELKKKIEEKWEEENRKKMEEMKIEMEKKKVDEESDVDDEEELIEDEEMEESENTTESEAEEDDVLINESKKKKNPFIDNEAEESDCEGEESGNDGGDELDDYESEQLTENNCTNAPSELMEPLGKGEFTDNHYSDSQSSLIPPYQPGGGMLHGGSDLTQNDEDISLPKNVLSPTLRLSLNFSQATKNAGSQQSWDIDLESAEESSSKSNLVPCFPENKNYDLTDAYELCSGKFPSEGGESQDPCQGETISEDFTLTSNNNSQLDSNPFDSLIGKERGEVHEEREIGRKKRSRLRIASDVSDDEIVRPVDGINELEDITKGRFSPDSSSEKSLPIRSRGKRKKLVFSDEEDDPESEMKIEEETEEENEFENEEEDSSQNVEEEDYEVEREVEYDLEEAEVVNMGEYFEKEAELSGSEWSGDEDEQGLDEFEMEDGDEDQLDEKKVRSELEKIHMRTLLDDDAREVRLLQEILFEDGDLFDDGPKRERNFRWKDLGTYFDKDENDENDAGKSQGQEDVEEDEEMRKIRHEKELFLLQMKSKREEMGLDEDEYETSLLKRGRIILKRSSLTTTKTANISQMVKTEADEMNFKTPFPLMSKRGSFLSRNEEFLARLAKFTSNATDNILGPKHSKNFIFVSKVPEKEAESSKENSHPKRKNPHLKDDLTKNKKVKLDEAATSSKISVLDRLL